MSLKSEKRVYVQWTLIHEPEYESNLLSTDPTGHPAHGS